MVSYQQGRGDLIVRLNDDGSRAEFHPDPASVDFQAYLTWEALPGNNIGPADVPPIIYTGISALVGRVTTTNATPTEIFRGTLAQATAYIATLDVIGVQGTAPFDRCVIRASASAARVGGGAVLDGQDFIHPPFKTAGATAWVAVGAVSGNDFIIRVTGEAGKTINWVVRGEFYSYTPGGA